MAEKELYKKYRPKDFEGVVGQTDALKSLQQMAKNKKIPHTLLFTGPSGCGKTTLARIVRKELGCGKHDFSEVNCADFRGIDMVRDIRSRMMQAPISGSCRVWLIDEAHRLTGDAMDAFLKILEDTPDHVYFMLATTNPQKLLKTVRTRCTEISVKSLSNKDIVKLVTDVAKKEGKTLPKEVAEKIADKCEGSARQALVLLHQIIDLENEDDMLDSIESNIAESQAINIARTLMNERTKWSEMAKVLKECDLEDPESIRWMVLGYAKSILLSGGKLLIRAYLVIDAFKDNFFDSKAAGLTWACYSVIMGSK